MGTSENEIGNGKIGQFSNVNFKMEIEFGNGKIGHFSNVNCKMEIEKQNLENMKGKEIGKLLQGNRSWKLKNVNGKNISK